MSARRLVIAAAMGIMGFAVSAQAQGQAKVGVALPLTGHSSIAGQEVLRGVKLAFEDFNAKGGALGGAVAAITEDDEGSPTKGTVVVRKLIESDKVCALVATYNSDVALAESKIAREAKIPMSSGGSTSIAVTDANAPGDPWFFRAFPGSDVQGEQSAVDTVKTLGKKRIAILHDNSNYGAAVAMQFKKVVAAAGAEILADETYNLGEQDFHPLLQRLKLLKPEAVYIGGIIAEGVLIVRQAQEIGFQPQFVGAGSFMTDKFIELTGSASEGFAVSTMFEPDTPNGYGRAFNDRFKKRYGDNANVFSALGYDSAAVVLEAIKRAGKCDGPAIRDAMKALKGFPLVQGPNGTTLDYDAKGGSYFKIGMGVIKSGKRQIVPN